MSRRRAGEITEARHMTGQWLLIIIKIIMMIGPNGSILTSQINRGFFFKSRKLLTKFKVLIPVLISNRVCCDVRLCRWLISYRRFEGSVTTFMSKYEEDACFRNVDSILPVDTAPHHRRLASSGSLLPVQDYPFIDTARSLWVSCEHEIFWTVK